MSVVRYDGTLLIEDKIEEIWISDDINLFFNEDYVVLAGGGADEFSFNTKEEIEKTIRALELALSLNWLAKPKAVESD